MKSDSSFINPVEFHGIRAISVSLNSSFITHHSSFAAGAESAKLDEVIRKNLEGLGYGS